MHPSNTEDQARILNFLEANAGGLWEICYKYNGLQYSPYLGLRSSSALTEIEAFWRERGLMVKGSFRIFPGGDLVAVSIEFAPHLDPSGAVAIPDGWDRILEFVKQAEASRAALDRVFPEPPDVSADTRVERRWDAYRQTCYYYYRSKELLPSVNDYDFYVCGPTIGYKKPAKAAGILKRLEKTREAYEESFAEARDRRTAKRIREAAEEELQPIAKELGRARSASAQVSHGTLHVKLWIDSPEQARALNELISTWPKV